MLVIFINKLQLMTITENIVSIIIRVNDYALKRRIQVLKRCLPWRTVDMMITTKRCRLFRVVIHKLNLDFAA
jgi:hypothetical protein